jgi:hypothetical protein
MHVVSNNDHHVVGKCSINSYLVQNGAADEEPLSKNFTNRFFRIHESQTYMLLQPSIWGDRRGREA